MFKNKDELREEIIELTNSGYETIDSLLLKENLLKNFVAKLINRSN